eukprot:6196298-Alexandrium_andersonii.AAC.1
MRSATAVPSLRSSSIRRSQVQASVGCRFGAVWVWRRALAQSRLRPFDRSRYLTGRNLGLSPGILFE